MTDVTAETIEGYRTGTWTLDAAHSEIAFTVRHLKISKVRGVFRTFDVTVDVAPNPAETVVHATIDVSSVDTGQEMRDGHLKTSDFFAIEAHPTITFESTSLRFTSAETFELVGDLTLKGVTKSVTLKGEFGGIVADAYGNVKAGAEASVTINRHDYGVSWNAALEAGGFTLGDDVKISFDLQFAAPAV